MSNRNYFNRSPFHSAAVSAATCLLAAFLAIGFTTLRRGSYSSSLRMSGALPALLLLPAAVWVWSMFMYLEIRMMPSQPSASSRFSRLPRITLCPSYRSHAHLLLSHGEAGAYLSLGGQVIRE